MPRCFARSLLLLLAGFIGCAPSPDAGSSSPPPTLVSTATPLERDFQDYEDYTGTVAAQFSVELRSRVTGYLDKIEFQDGAEVEKDALLFVIDRRPFQAASDSAKALVAVKKAASEFRDAEFKRNQELLSKNAVSKSEYDQSAAAFAEAKAMVSSSEAEAEIANLNLQFTEIHSPIAGLASNRKLDIGNLVIADQTLLTSVVSVDPVYVNFTVDERRLQRIQQEVRDGRIKLAENGRIPIQLGLDNEVGFPHPGTIEFIDNQIDSKTGSMPVRATVPNPLPPLGKRKLVPGMYARVRVPLGEPRKALFVAEQAVGSDQGQKFVYVVDAAKKVQSRRVRLGRSERGLVVVEEGLTAGEPIVVAGVQRVRPGAVVETNVVEMQSFAAAAQAPPADKGSAPEAAAAQSAAPAATAPIATVPVATGPAATGPALIGPAPTAPSATK